jgi:hypothetical protein
MSLHDTIIRIRHYMSKQFNNKVFHIHLREEAHDKELPQELQYHRHKIVYIVSVLFYPTTLRNFIITFYILYPSILTIIYVNETSYLKTL